MTLSCSYAEIDWTTDNQPLSRQFGDIYFSSDNGLAETHHVFLQHNVLPERWKTAEKKRPFVIMETGFGSGLNFLTTWHTYAETARLDSSLPPLHFISLEKYPLTPDDAHRALKCWPLIQTLASALLAVWPQPINGCHRNTFDDGRVTLDLWLGDAITVLRTLIAQADAWYLDGFAPSRNPDLWQPTLYEHMARLSRPGATFATYTAAGNVRRGLEAVGFSVHKACGYGRKREMLHGVINKTVLPTHPLPPWLRPPSSTVQEKRAIIIGGGLAGTSTALALVRSGWHCHLLDKSEHLAAGASGNRQAVFYPLLSAGANDLGNDWALTHFLYADRHLHRLETAGYAPLLQRCGVLQGAFDERSRRRIRQIAAQAGLPASVMQFVNAAETARFCGFDIAQDALWFPSGGWISAADLCRAQWQMAADSGQAQFDGGVSVSDLQMDGDGWQVHDTQGGIWSAPVVILANAHQARQFDITAYLPLQTARGQVTCPPMTPLSQFLTAVISRDGFITPAWDGRHCLGATYDRNSEDTTVYDSDNTANFTRLARYLPALATSFAAGDSTARSSIRCNSPDHLPLVGPVIDVADFRHRYADLKDGKRWTNYTEPKYLKGLYVNLAHGARGLVTTPLCADYLASLLNAAPLPYNSSLMAAALPHRFLVRALIRDHIF